MALAAEALAEHAGGAQFAVDGEAVKGALYRRFSQAALAGHPSLSPMPAQTATELVTTVVRRADRAGTGGRARLRDRAQLLQARRDEDRFAQSLAQNERVVVALKVTETEARYARLMIVDKLPAGLEIDNPALVDGGAVEALRLAHEGRRAGAHRISRRPLRRRLRPRRGTVRLHRRRLCRARRRARPLHLSAGDRGGHVRPRTLRPHRLRRDRGDGEMSALTPALSRLRERGANGGRGGETLLPLAGEGGRAQRGRMRGFAPRPG